VNDTFVKKALAKKALSPTLSFGLLVVLIAAAPVLAITPGWIGPQSLALAVAIMLLTLPGAPRANVARSLAIFKPLAAAAMLPAAWMLLQIVPVPLGSIEHPVWRSAAAALGTALSGHISIDVGYTLRGFFGYLSLISLAFSTAVITRNRDHAETLLSALCTITTFIAVELILSHDMALFKPDSSPGDFTDSLVAAAAFGTILNVALMVRAAERHETRASRQPWRLRNTLGMILLGTTGALVCLVALIHCSTGDTLLATACGLTVICLVVLVRRLRLARWTAAMVCFAVLVAWGGVIALRLAADPLVNPLFRFAKSDAANAAATLRMMSDANWTGAGVGTYQALAAIYRDAVGVPRQAAIDTIASTILEWGRVGVLIAFVLLLQSLLALFRGALSRGKDSFYPASAAACLATVLCEAFCDASFTDITVQMLTAIIVGLGLSQSASNRAA
jgi:hypothetical protein